MLGARREVHRRAAIDLIEPAGGLGRIGLSGQIGRHRLLLLGGFNQGAVVLDEGKGGGLIVGDRSRLRRSAADQDPVGIGDVEVLRLALGDDLLQGRRVGKHRLRRGFRLEVPLGLAAALRRRALAKREPLGQKRLVGGGAEVVAELAADAAAQDRAQQLLDRGRDLGGAGAVRGPGGLAAPDLALERDRALDGLLRLGAIGVAREGGDAHRQADPGRALALEQEAQREQVVVERVDGAAAI